MATILDAILSEKRIEVEKLKLQTVKPSYTDQKHHSFISILRDASDLSIIAEFKRASPSKGVINTGLNPAEQTKSYIQ